MFSFGRAALGVVALPLVLCIRTLSDIVCVVELLFLSWVLSTIAITSRSGLQKTLVLNDREVGEQLHQSCNAGVDAALENSGYFLS